MTPPGLGADALLRAELERMTRLMVEVRANLSWRVFIPMSVVAALDPRWPRVLLLAVSGAVLVAFSLRERGRLGREGYSASFAAQNVVAMATVHLVFFLTTGGLASPLLPVMVVFTFAAHALLEAGPPRRAVLAFQVLGLSALGLAWATGLSARLSPGWMAVASPVHALTSYLATLGMLGVASRLGGGLRGIFERVLVQVADARQDLLEARSAQAEELTALAGAIAHELKNPLASVKGLAGLLARDLSEGKAAERLGVLRREVDRMQGTLEEFLNFSRPTQALELGDLDLAALAADVVALHEGLARDRGVRLVVEGEGRGRGELRKARQVLINLVQNALDAGPTTVVLRVAPGETWVEDDGAGLDPAVAARVFEAGVTTRPKGSGLGLTIARALARQLGGDVELESRPKGCRARVRWG